MKITIKLNIYGDIQFMLKPLRREKWGVCTAHRDAVIVAPYCCKGRLIELQILGLRHGQGEEVPILQLPLMHPMAMNESFNFSMPQFLSACC